MVDVYHEFSHPFEMTEAMVKALKPGGRLVFVEFRLEDPKVPIKLVHKMSEKQVIKEMGPHPLKHAKTHDACRGSTSSSSRRRLRWQHRRAIMALARRTVQNMPDCLRRELRNGDNGLTEKAVRHACETRRHPKA